MFSSSPLKFASTKKFLLAAKLSLAVGATIIFTFCSIGELSAQGRGQGRGFRIGNVVQAGGGQGFRMGTQRLGMHFGGGQGASIGGPNAGMRFGNGQGARIGGNSYGMQFGGQQGSQIGNFATTPTVNPGTYYYGNVRNPDYAPRQTYTMQPKYYAQQPAYVQQPNYVQNAPLQPNAYQPNTYQPNFIQAGQQYQSTLAPAQTNPQAGAGSTDTLVANTTGLEDKIELKYPAEATGALTYQLNGTELTLEPGKSVYMAADQDWKLLFSGGEGFEEREAVLSEAGSFVFNNTADEGWILIKGESVATDVVGEAAAVDQATVVMAPDEPTENDDSAPDLAPQITPPVAPDESQDKNLDENEGNTKGGKSEQEAPIFDPIESLEESVEEEPNESGLPEAAVEGLNLEGSEETVIEEVIEGGNNK